MNGFDVSENTDRMMRALERTSKVMPAHWFDVDGTLRLTCPACRSDCSAALLGDGTTAFKLIECMSCGARWIRSGERYVSSLGDCEHKIAWTKPDHLVEEFVIKVGCSCGHSVRVELKDGDIDWGET